MRLSHFLCLTLKLIQQFTFMINVNLCAVQPFFFNKYERKIWETLSAALKLELIGTGNQSSCKFFAAY